MDSLGDRMKRYEQAYKYTLPMRIPVIMRLDGRAFHTFTKDMDKPFDERFIQTMTDTAIFLCQELATVRLAYVQSDEISLLLHDYTKLETQAWFGNEVQKQVSVAAGLASSYFTFEWDRRAVFDARVFVLPESDVNNYFLWRQQDAIRNSILGLAQSLYSQSELHGKDRTAMMDMMFAKGVNWNDLTSREKSGTFLRRVVKLGDDDETVISRWEETYVDVGKDKSLIEDALRVEEE
jgi:tRNA(His) guanylyltransferase